MPYTPAEIFARVAFYPTLLYTYVMSRVSSRQWYDRIDQWVIIGALPVRSIAQQLVEEEKIKGVVSLTQDFETDSITPTEQEWQEMGVQQLKVSTVDFTGTPSQDKITTAVGFIMRHRENNQSVYVHCKAGRTRSATVVACYLIEANQWTPDQAVEFIKGRRAHIWLREKQLKSIHAFFTGSPLSSTSSSTSTGSSRSSGSSKSSQI